MRLGASMQTSTAAIADRQAADRASAGQIVPDCGLAVCVRGLAKHYVHPWTLRVTRGLEALDLDVRRGEVMGLLGPNGAGKTTTLKLLTGLLKPTRGQAWLMGQPVDRTAARRGLGFLPEQPYFYDYLNGLEYLELAARLSGLPAATARERALHWLERVGLGERARLGLRRYSKGMLQRLGLAAALVHDPELLILDEPMSGLDPFGRRDVRDLIIEQRERGATVLFSSHILPDVEMLCDRVAIMIGGRLTRVATVGELVEGGPQAVEIRCAPGALLEIPRDWAGLVSRSQRAGESVFRLEDETRLRDVLGWLLQAGVQVRAVTPQRPTLESLFMAAADAEGARRTA
jgi:ABC-2 type transport system ATP-binding protein